MELGRNEETRRARRAAVVALAGLVVLAAALRLVGIGYLLPEIMNRDGLVLARQVEILRGGGLRPEDDPWHFGFYPHLMARIAALWPETTPTPAVPIALERHLDLASAPWIQLRAVSVLLALLAIPATYLLARRFVGRASALFAAALVATSLHHIVLSIQEKPHAAATSLVTIALVAALRLRRKPDVVAYLVVGLTAGLALGTLQTAGVCVLAVAAAFLLRRRTPESASGAWILATAGIVVACSLALYPFFLGPPAAEAGPGATAATTGIFGFGRHVLAGLGGARVRKLLGATFGLDPLLVGSAGIGIVLAVVAICRDPSRLRAMFRGDLGVLLALAVPCAAVLLSYRETLVRFFLPFLPLLACLAGYAHGRAREAWLARREARPRGNVGFSLLSAALLAVPLVPAVHFARIRTRPSPMEEAASWVEAHVPAEETVVVVPRHDLPLLLDEAAIAWNTRVPGRSIWSDYLAAAPPASLLGTRRRILVEPGERPRSRTDLQDDPVAYLEKAGARTLVVELSGWPSGCFRDRLPLAARISPASDDDGRGRGVVLWGTGFDPLRPSVQAILELRTLGTAVEIYRLR